MKHKQFENYRQFSVDIAGKTYTFETGKMAELANSALLCRCGESAILARSRRPPVPARCRLFPASIDFEEKSTR
jgi:polyribonucleotide nucleotidyltransferase